MGTIAFFSEATSFELPDPAAVQAWLMEVIEHEQKAAGALNIIFCSDEYLYDINREHLHHDTLTDVITFDYSDEPDTLSGDSYISVDRVRDNAQQLQVPFAQELLRVLVHGILHLAGHHDKTPTQKQQMRQLEDRYLELPCARAAIDAF